MPAPRDLPDSSVRRPWVARLVLFILFMAAFLAGATEPLGAAAQAATIPAIVVPVPVRFGMLASATLWFTLLVPGIAPLRLNWSSWYAGHSFAVLGLFTTLLVTAFDTSLGGKPVFGKALLDE